jgi:hypothetical protein
MSDVIQILNAIDGGEPHAADQLLPLRGVSAVARRGSGVVLWMKIW